MYPESHGAILAAAFLSIGINAGTMRTFSQTLLSVPRD